MARWRLERQLKAVHGRLKRARERLAVAEADLSILAEQSDEDGLRALVSEGGIDRAEASASGKHTDAARRAVESLRVEISTLERQLDDLLDNR